MMMGQSSRAPGRAGRCRAGRGRPVLAGAMLAAAGLLGAGIAGAPSQAQQAQRPGQARPAQAQPAPTQPAQPAAAEGILGFRSARFGMTEAELRAALRRDFPGSEQTIAAGVHPTERTRVLRLPLPDLIPGTGEAQAFYVLGFESRRLTMVTLAFASNPARGVPAESIVAAANQLRDYFAALPFIRAEGRVTNQPLADGSMLAFRGADAEGRMVSVVLTASATPIGTVVPGPAAEQQGAAQAGAAQPGSPALPLPPPSPAAPGGPGPGGASPAAPGASTPGAGGSGPGGTEGQPARPQVAAIVQARLIVTYARDPQNPDIFRIRPGQF